jgi:cytochrome c oxidase assembly protein subunit 15
MLSRNKGYMRNSVRLVAPMGAVAAVVLVMAVGVTGSLAALGDTLFPASSLGQALAQDFSSTSGWLVRWRWTHPTFAFVSSVFLIWLLVRAKHELAGIKADLVSRRLSATVLLLLVAQYVLGVFDVFLLAPVWLQVAHLLGADLLWVALVVLSARLTIQPAGSMAGQPNS